MDNSKLSKILGTDIISASCRTKGLKGGTLGDVQLVTGLAETIDGKQLPFKFVLKIQKKWNRPGDPNSWRREHDLYLSDLEKSFTDLFGWPKCYHTEIKGDEVQIWMEYIEGISSGSLTIGMLEQAAFELGRFQGRHFNKTNGINHITCLGDTGFLEPYCYWRGN